MIRLAALFALAVFLASCGEDTKHRILISTASQQMIVLRKGVKIAQYPVSTSKFGLGDTPGSNGTPLGLLKVHKKIGAEAPSGTVFKSRRPTGEVLPVDAPGRDPIVTRILWLDGLEADNRHACERFIYIHGTPEERTIGTPTSYGCVRMRSRDVIALFDTVGVGTRVKIVTQPFLTDSGTPESTN